MLLTAFYKEVKLVCKIEFRWLGPPQYFLVLMEKNNCPPLHWTKKPKNISTFPPGLLKKRNIDAVNRNWVNLFCSSILSIKCSRGSFICHKGKMVTANKYNYTAFLFFTLLFVSHPITFHVPPSLSSIDHEIFFYFCFGFVLD